MKQLFLIWCLVMMGISICLQNIHAMDPLIKVRRKFKGQELTALAIIDRSNERRDSITFCKKRKPIAVFDYHEQKVIVHLNAKTRCKVPYDEFKNLMLGKENNKKVLEKRENDTENSALWMRYADDCCIS